jgi:hypothetical protein
MMSKHVALVALACCCLIDSAAALYWRDALRLAQESLGTDVFNSKSPAFCHGLDCPEFKLKENTSFYEVREYKGADWVGTSFVDSHFGTAIARGFARLFEYISGANEDSKKIKMTAPVATLIQLGDDMKPTGNYSVAFYLPKDFQGKAPAPTGTDVHVHTTKKRTAYVSSFGGFATESKVLEEAALLGKALTADKIDVATRGFIFASYDPPYRLTGRHNEVWVFSEDE